MQMWKLYQTSVTPYAFFARKRDAIELKGILEKYILGEFIIEEVNVTVIDDAILEKMRETVKEIRDLAQCLKVKNIINLPTPI